VTARVAPEDLRGDDLLAGLEGQQNALILETELLEEIAIVQRSGSLTQTAYALLSDLITISRGLAGRPGGR
jgi:homoserine dehydrogenase